MEIRFNICDKVYYLNTVTCKVDSAEVKGIQVMPTGISRDAEGKNVLDGCVVLYQTVEGPTLTGGECFASADECRDAWREIVGEL